MLSSCCCCLSDSLCLWLNAPQHEHQQQQQSAGAQHCAVKFHCAAAADAAPARFAFCRRTSRLVARQKTACVNIESSLAAPSLSPTDPRVCSVHDFTLLLSTHYSWLLWHRTPAPVSYPGHAFLWNAALLLSCRLETFMSLYGAKPLLFGVCPVILNYSGNVCRLKWTLLYQ